MSTPNRSAFTFASCVALYAQSTFSTSLSVDHRPVTPLDDKIRVPGGATVTTVRSGHLSGVFFTCLVHICSYKSDVYIHSHCVDQYIDGINYVTPLHVSPRPNYYGVYVRACACAHFHGSMVLKTNEEQLIMNE